MSDPPLRSLEAEFSATATVRHALLRILTATSASTAYRGYPAAQEIDSLAAAELSTLRIKNFKTRGGEIRQEPKLLPKIGWPIRLVRHLWASYNVSHCNQIRRSNLKNITTLPLPSLHRYKLLGMPSDADTCGGYESHVGIPWGILSRYNEKARLRDSTSAA
ncbi:hypothetical protein GJ744_001146 [Endocarpon pusillum]|uniref:Uncharacterized protein n=1 Tax=Endocarpon pusillum TaxID=364733 RepID=A0A8H7ACK5_9EURO|nr:hypothetical protein GJ744_001146 [Endocarpon pusillum]